MGHLSFSMIHRLTKRHALQTKPVWFPTAVHSIGFYVQMAICANSPWLADLVSELYTELQSLDQSIVAIDLVFFIINKVPEAADDASMMLVIAVPYYM